jgi:acylphosphatase
MRRAIIIAKGDVQRVGYRDVVERAARRLNVKGFVENVKPYDVRIIAEGKEKALDEFIAQIRIRKFPIFVDDLGVRLEDATGGFEYFEIRRADWRDELGERLDTAGTLLYRSVELSEKTVDLGEESVRIGRTMLEKQDEMLEKQDEMLEKQDEMLEKQDEMLEKQDETIGEIRGLREDLKPYMDKRFKVIEKDIVEIKVKLGMI